MSARRGTWRAIGESVIGVTHDRDGRPCQDYCGVHSSTPGAIVAAIADGHGQAKSFRSQVGARIAVEVATEVLLGFARSEAGTSDDAFGVRKDLAGHLPRVVAQTWRERVLEHVEQTIPTHAFIWPTLPQLQRPRQIEIAPRGRLSHVAELIEAARL